MDLISDIKSHLDKVEKRKIEDKRKIKIGSIKGPYFIELLDKSCDILKAKNDYERTINELRRIYNNQRLEFANREELMRFARIEIYNYDDGGIKIELTDIFHDLDDYDKVHMLCQAIVKTLFDMGDQSFLLTSILYEFHKSIIKKRYKNINRDISFSKIIDNVENNYLLYFDIRQHLKINNFYIIDKYSGSNDSIESYQFIFHKQNMNIVTHSYPPIHLSKVLLPINICALFNYFLSNIKIYDEDHRCLNLVEEALFLLLTLCKDNENGFDDLNHLPGLRLHIQEIYYSKDL